MDLSRSYLAPSWSARLPGLHARRQLRPRFDRSRCPSCDQIGSQGGVDDPDVAAPFYGYAEATDMPRPPAWSGSALGSRPTSDAPAKSTVMSSPRIVMTALSSDESAARR